MNLFANSKFDMVNQKLLNLFSYCNKLSTYKYTNLLISKKVFLIPILTYLIWLFIYKNNFNDLKHYDTISIAYIIFDGIDELISKYYLTELCTKCNPFGKKVEKKYNLIFIFNSYDINNVKTLNYIIKSKFTYEKAQCPFYR